MSAISALNDARDALTVSIEDALSYAQNLISKTSNVKIAITNAKNDETIAINRRNNN
ncbi:hypothetical protein [Clostridium puniceum]|uniref:hypothetical protein n=1 Tax=Clostridium puniceum TaxID=29367 RepID=UPI001300F525|nr:hypothetical protein [Clostridium puniceum]